MATTVDVTTRFLNQDKRYTESVVVTLPAILKTGGGRSNAKPEHIMLNDALTAQVIEADTAIMKAYVIVDEAFKSGTKLAVDIAGTAMFNGVDVSSTGLSVSAVEDAYFAKGQTVTSVISHDVDIPGTPVSYGKVRVVLAVVHPSLKNGQFAN